MMEEITVSGPMLLFLVCMTGFAGVVDSAAGGGGLISLPAYLFAGLPVHYTYGTNKFSAACGTTFAAARFFKGGALDVRVGLLAAAGSFAGSALGAQAALLLSDRTLHLLLLVILPCAAAVIVSQWRRPEREGAAAVALTPARCALALGIGFGIGCYDGLFGPGTGTFAILAFNGLMGFELRCASGNAKLLNLASNYASLATYLASGLVVFPIAIPCAVSGIAGNLIGSRLALRGGGRVIRPMMLVVLGLLLIELLNEAL